MELYNHHIWFPRIRLWIIQHSEKVLYNDNMFYPSLSFSKIQAQRKGQASYNGTLRQIIRLCVECSINKLASYMHHWNVSVCGFFLGDRWNGKQPAVWLKGFVWLFTVSRLFPFSPTCALSSTSASTWWASLIMDTLYFDDPEQKYEISTIYNTAYWWSSVLFHKSLKNDIVFNNDFERL